MSLHFARLDRKLALAAGLILLSFLLYGSHTFEPPLSDDYVSLQLAEEGATALVRSATVDSYPRTLRPLPALLWTVRLLPTDLSLVHAIGFLVHGVNGALVGLLGVLLGASAVSATLSTVAFVVFPLFAEPVIWASCGPDRIATLAGLVTLCLWVGARRGGHPIALSLCASAALLSKESTLTLPLICLALPAGAHRRVTLGAFVPFAVYMAFRLLMFGGLGGYDVTDVPAMWPASERLSLSLFVYFPYLILVPISAAGWQRWLLGVVSIGVLASLVWRTPLAAWRRPLWVFVLALMPTLPVLGLDADRLGGRFFYWPSAVAFPLIACALPGGAASRRAVWAGLLLLWTGAAVVNGRAWTAAAQEVSNTIQAMRRAQGALDAGTIVMVDAKDSVGGYVFRNGLPEAAKVLGLRQDVEWRRGTGADLSDGESHELGGKVRVVGVGPAGVPRELTACERSVQTAPEMLGRVWPNDESGPATRTAPATSRAKTFRVGPVQGSMAVFAALRTDAADPQGQGLVQWRTVGTPFSMSRSRTFSPDRKPVTYVRVDLEPGKELELRLVLPTTLPLSEVRLVTAGRNCSPGE